MQCHLHQIQQKSSIGLADNLREGLLEVQTLMFCLNALANKPLPNFPVGDTPRH